MESTKLSDEGEERKVGAIDLDDAMKIRANICKHTSMVYYGSIQVIIEPIKSIFRNLST